MILVPNSLQSPRYQANISDNSGEFSVSHIYFFIPWSIRDKQENFQLGCQSRARDSSPGYLEQKASVITVTMRSFVSMTLAPKKNVFMGQFSILV